MRRLLLAFAFALSLLAPTAQTQAAGCAFQLGFATVHDLAPDQVGDCVDDERHNPDNGDGLQHTTKGLMVWRKADNWTAFTNGYQTWVNGPNGLQQRLNTQRFSFEANPDGLSIADPPRATPVMPGPQAVPAMDPGTATPQTVTPTTPSVSSGTSNSASTLLPPGSHVPADATAVCRDGSISFSAHASGTCAWHGGVLRWVNHP